MGSSSSKAKKIPEYKYQHHRYRLATDGFIHSMDKLLDQVIPDIVIEICYQFFICENIMFQVEITERKCTRSELYSGPREYNSKQDLLRLRHFYNNYLCASLFNPCTVSGHPDLNEFSTSEWRYNDIDGTLDIAGAYLKIYRDGTVDMVDYVPSDKGGEQRVFNIIRYPQFSSSGCDIISLESRCNPGKFLAVNDKLYVYTHDMNKENYHHQQIKTIMEKGLKDDTIYIQQGDNYVGISKVNPIQVIISKNLDDIDGEWIKEKHSDHDNMYKFRNTVTGKYLRTTAVKTTNSHGQYNINCGGIGGKDCIFEIKRNDDGHVSIKGNMSNHHWEAEKVLCIYKGKQRDHISLTNMVRKCPKCGVFCYKNYNAIQVWHHRSLGGCGYHFCWLCGGDWNDHGAVTGGYYECYNYNMNVFRNKKQKGQEPGMPKNALFNIVNKINTLQE